jgi:hypothetical protein
LSNAPSEFIAKDFQQAARAFEVMARLVGKQQCPGLVRLRHERVQQSTSSVPRDGSIRCA